MAKGPFPDRTIGDGPERGDEMVAKGSGSLVIAASVALLLLT
jgi:hypothetical protein